jgi:hypothetical protein
MSDGRYLPNGRARRRDERRQEFSQGTRPQKRWATAGIHPMDEPAEELSDGRNLPKGREMGDGGYLPKGRARRRVGRRQVFTQGTSPQKRWAMAGIYPGDEPAEEMGDGRYLPKGRARRRDGRRQVFTQGTSPRRDGRRQVFTQGTSPQKRWATAGIYPRDEPAEEICDARNLPDAQPVFERGE